MTARGVWHAALFEAIAFAKAADRPDDAWVRRVEVGDGDGYLLPVCRLHRKDDAAIARFSRWRSASQHAFPTRFPVTDEGTRRWLDVALLDRPDRMLFLVCDPVGTPIGHVGLVVHEDAVEADNIVRGEAAAPGLMGTALRALLAWAEEEAAPPATFLRVLEDNAHAIAFYRRLGFVDAGTEPLVTHVDGDRVSLVPPSAGEQPDTAFLRMDYLLAAEPSPGTILTAGPSITAREAVYALDATRHGWNARWSGYLDRFEQGFRDLLDVPHAVATSGGTGALHLAFAACGIGPGDEVIVPDITWVATANAVTYTGATPVFCDVEAGSWCMDPDAFEAAITERTRVVAPVHLYGQPARMERIVAIARAHGLLIVEDAAPAIGATRDGRLCGTFGDLAAFSFQGAKLLVTGEGGMLVGTNDALFARARSLWDQGRVPGTFDIAELGWKYKMANVQAAVGLGQLERLAPMVEAKRRIHGWYAEELAGVAGLELQTEDAGSRSIYWMTNVRVLPESGTTRDAVRGELRAAGIDTRPVFPTISQYPYWERRQAAAPVATQIAAQGINLPSGVRLTRADIARAGEALRDAVTAARAAA